ncbi:E3 ubiquitin-protein ligase rnf168-like isoform X2 [Homarus americanus]|uniref:E3 ubiquitin-protein ligase rnf168-like isoform X2 n=1 Tax=Homarus americanus TaxID=6706 RepID=UPI001C47D67A|nr:E3 ubiquitin-protein ligase rnf168-like isoform X2 [Homarus americanus]
MASYNVNNCGSGPDSRELSISDVMCPICLSILIEPVTMPCSHSLCMQCFNQQVAQTSLACPLCRKRISVWVRRTSKTNRLIDTKLWQKIRDKFSAKVEARIRGVDDTDSEVFVPVHSVSAPGEIRQEYETFLAKQLEEAALRKTEEEIASNRLIQLLQDQEKMKLRERRKEQELLAEKDAMLAHEVKEAEKMCMEEKLKQFRELCASDEAVARQIEKTEWKEQKQRLPQNAKDRSGGSSKLGRTSNKPVKTPHGPMDVYIGSNMRVITKTNQDINDTPTTSSARASSSPISSSRLDTTDVAALVIPLASGSISACVDNRIWRQLREITSSQSSESEPEDLTLSSQLGNRHRQINSGKENTQRRRKNSPCKSGKGKLAADETKIINIQDSPDIECYSGIIGLNCNNAFREDNDSDETDIENSVSTNSQTITNGKDKVIVNENDCNRLVNEKPKTHDCIHECGGGTEKETAVGEVCDSSTGKLGLHRNAPMELTSIINGLEFNPESLATLVAEQHSVEALLKQEEEDRLLAEALQREFNQDQRRVVNRSRGSEDEYKLRNRHLSTRTAHKGVKTTSGKSPSQKKTRQPTIRESIAKRQKKV